MEMPFNEEKANSELATYLYFVLKGAACGLI